MSVDTPVCEPVEACDRLLGQQSLEFVSRHFFFSLGVRR
jgi:hypothetical protein